MLQYHQQHKLSGLYSIDKNHHLKERTFFYIEQCQVFKSQHLDFLFARHDDEISQLHIY